MRVGIDVIEIERVTEDESFLKKIALKSEIEYIKSFKCEKGRLERIASLWCVKEAVFKCLGLGRDSGVTTKHVELCHEESGQPYVKLSGVAKKAFDSLGLKEIEISLSHSTSIATAIAIAN